MSFSSIQMMKSGLSANQAGIDIVGHNIANANTEGYSRQRVIIESVVAPASFSKFAPIRTQILQAGVNVDSIQRVTDEFLSKTYRNSQSRESHYDVSKNSLGLVESMMDDMGDYGISAELGNFFDSLQDLNGDNGSEDKMMLVREQAISLTGTINNNYSIISDELSNQMEQMELRVVHTNDICNNIATLNQEIKVAKSVGIQPNDLYDKRDLLLDELSSYINIDCTEDASGIVTVEVASVALIDSTGVREIFMDTSSGDSAALRFSSDNSLVDLSEGYLMGYLEMINGGLGAGYQGGEEYGLVSIMNNLDTLTNEFMNSINAINQAGVKIDGSGLNGSDLFIGTGAKDIEISADWANSVYELATSFDGQVGDGRNVMAMLEYRESEINFGDFNSTIQDANINYSLMLGSAISKSDVQYESANMAKDAIYFQKQSVSSVSIDEEMINMVQYEQAYKAVSRVITAMDEMLDTIINRTGLAGR